jgi:hypothetical protein
MPVGTLARFGINGEPKRGSHPNPAALTIPMKNPKCGPIGSFRPEQPYPGTIHIDHFLLGSAVASDCATTIIIDP